MNSSNKHNSDDAGNDASNDANMDGFVDMVRLIRAPLSARQRSAGWQTLQQAIVTRRVSGRVTRRWFADESFSGWWSRRGWSLGLAFAMIAVLIPVGWGMLKSAGSKPLQYVVSGDPGVQALAATGGVLSAKTGGAQLLFTDGSRIGMRAAARLTVAALMAKGSDVRLLDGTIDVDVRHQPDTAWTFEAGPYAVHVKGTSFALGWDAARKRLELRMRSGAVALVGPAGTPSHTVTGSQSLFLDETGNPLAAAAAAAAVQADAPAEVTPVTSSAPPQVADPTQTPHAGRNRSGQDRRTVRTLLPHDDWAPLLARGNFDAIVEQAQKSGIDVCLRSDTEQNLAALADAARYTHRSGLARRSLMAMRARFPSTDRARDAAFFIARLSETTTGGVGEALSWYERYLREAAGGSYAEEALGREMILLRRQGGKGGQGGQGGDAGVHARNVAGRYLKAYPHGVYANEAARCLEAPPAP